MKTIPFDVVHKSMAANGLPRPVFNCEAFAAVNWRGIAEDIRIVLDLFFSRILLPTLSQRSRKHIVTNLVGQPQGSLHNGCSDDRTIQLSVMRQKNVLGQRNIVSEVLRDILFLRRTLYWLQAPKAEAERRGNKRFCGWKSTCLRAGPYDDQKWPECDLDATIWISLHHAVAVVAILESLSMGSKRLSEQRYVWLVTMASFQCSWYV